MNTTPKHRQNEQTAHPTARILSNQRAAAGYIAKHRRDMGPTLTDRLTQRADRGVLDAEAYANESGVRR